MMKRWFTGDIIAIVGVIAFSLAALSPYMAGVFWLSADGILHLYRLVTLDHALSEGALWVRYVPGMVYGYGSPLFNYYSPLSLYPSWVAYLLGMSYLQAWLAGMAFYSTLAGVGAFLWGRALGGTITGLIAGVAYVYAPYTLFDAIGRGTISELASLAILPFILWGLWRLGLRPTRRNFAAVALLYAVFVPLHNVITLHASVMIGVYTLFVWWVARTRTGGAIPVRSIGFTAGALIFGMLISAFFWLPAITETGYVKIDAITANLPEIDVTRNLTTLDTLFAPPVTADPTQLQPPTPISLSWVQIALAGVVLVWVWRRGVDGILRGWVALSILLISVLIFMNLHASAPVWDVLPLIRYSQFPWRLVGLMSLLLAVLAGLGVAVLAERIRARAALVIVCAVMIALYGLPWTYAFPLPDVQPQDIISAQDYERETGYIGTSSFAEYVPVWSSELPYSDRLIARYQTAQVISRLSAPDGVQVQSAMWGHTSGYLRLNTDTETELVFDWFFFPGWQAQLNGEALTVTPTDPHGLVSVRVPPGDHILAIVLTRTERQALAETLSLLALVGLGALMLVRPLWRGGGQMPAPAPLFPVKEDAEEMRRLAIACVIAGVALFALKVTVIDTQDTPLKRERFAQGVEHGVEYPLNTNFNREITLLGYDLPQTTVTGSENIALNLYWQLSGERLRRDYYSMVTLTDSQGIQRAMWLEWQPAGISTSGWLPGGYVQERRLINIPEHTAPGEYALTVSLYNPTRGRGLNIINSADNPDGVAVSLSTITITRSATPSGVDVQSPLINAGDVQLLTTQGTPDNISAGGSFVLETLWSATGTPAQDTRPYLLWTSEDGSITEQSPDFMAVQDYPMTEWRAGDVWRGFTSVIVPGTLTGGVYSVALVLGDQLIELEEIDVTAPLREYTLPVDETLIPVEITWENGLTLAAYQFTEDGALILYWRAENRFTAPLRVFVHVVEGERLINVIDQIPVNWTRPVTGWIEGEVITDRYYPGEIPAGATIRVGWYSPEDQVRVRVGDDDMLDLIP